MSAESNQIAPESSGKAAESTENGTIVPVIAQETAATEQRSKKRDENFRRMEQKLRDTEDRLRQVESEKQRQPAQEQTQADDSDLVTAGQMRKIIEQEARRIANETVRQNDLATLGDRLQAKHPDFNEIVSEDAIEELKENHPEVFTTLRSNPDPYSKGLAAYKILKSFKGSSKEKDAMTKINEKKIEENRSKPNVGAGNTSVLSQASGWSKPSADMKKQLYADMKLAASKRS